MATATNNNNDGDDQAEKWRSCFRSDLFEGQVGLVTGGGSGIGQSIATELASLGATVVIASRDQSKCIKTAEEINKQVAASTTTPGADYPPNNNKSINNKTNQREGRGRGGLVVAGPSTNIRSEEDIERLVSHVISTYGKLNFVVNNAGGQFICPSEDISRRGFQAVMETNLLGTFLVCREAYNQYMRDHGGGSIVNITLGNRNGMPIMAHSGAARAGVENLTASLCAEWIHSGVRINCVRPGVIYTSSGAKNYGGAVEMFLERLLPSIPAKRLGTPEEISSAVTWLLSDGAKYVTGAIVCVDGGQSYTAVPLIDIEDKTHLPVYGTLPKLARL